jgi:hypothetical protein
MIEGRLEAGEAVFGDWSNPPPVVCSGFERVKEGFFPQNLQPNLRPPVFPPHLPMLPNSTDIKQCENTFYVD